MIQEIDLLASYSENLAVHAWIAGPPGTGKTSSLLSLLEVGYKIRLISADGNFQPLLRMARHRKISPQVLSNLQIRRVIQPIDNTLRPSKIGERSWHSLTTLVKRPWHPDEPRPADLDASHILVIDNLSEITIAAIDNVRISKNKLGPEDGLEFKEWGSAHDAIWRFCSDLNTFNCHVLFLCHVDHMQDPDNLNQSKGFPSTMGPSLGKKIAGTFPILFYYRIKMGKRIISTRPTSGIDVKSGLPQELLGDDLPIDTGLATIFEKVAGTPPSRRRMEEEKKSDGDQEKPEEKSPTHPSSPTPPSSPRPTTTRKVALNG